MTHMRLPQMLLFGALVATCALPFAAAASAGKPTAVVVTASDTSLAFRPARIAVGNAALSISSVGKRIHVVSIGGKTTGPVRPGATARLLVTFKSPGRVRGTSTTPAHPGVLSAALTIASSAAPATNDAGRGVFIQAGCSGCHTLRAANAAGVIGPNFDVAKPSIARIVDRVTNGYKGMPPFGGSLTTTEIAEVASFVYDSTH